MAIQPGFVPTRKEVQDAGNGAKPGAAPRSGDTKEKEDPLSNCADESEFRRAVRNFTPSYVRLGFIDGLASIGKRNELTPWV